MTAHIQGGPAASIRPLQAFDPAHTYATGRPTYGRERLDARGLGRLRFWDTMQTVLIIVHLIIVLALIGVVLLQRSEGGGSASAAAAACRAS